MGKYFVVPLLTVHHHWTWLTSTVAPDEVESNIWLSIATETELLKKIFEEGTTARKQSIKSMLAKIAYPDQTSMVLPLNKIKTMGGGRSQRNLGDPPMESLQSERQLMQK